jgi:16S rRNA processing protein RimM
MSKAEEYDRVVGRVKEAHGIKGEVKIVCESDRPGLMMELQSICIAPEAGEPLVTALQRVRQIPHREVYICQLEGVTDRTHAESLKGADVLVIAREPEQLPENTFYMDDILGLHVVTDDGRRLGEVVEILETGANDVYVTDQDVLIPAVGEVVELIDFETGTIRITPMPGMLD